MALDHLKTCRVCHTRIFYATSSHSGWWEHVLQPRDGHEAIPPTPLIDSTKD